jgi:hypothetical protein
MSSHGAAANVTSAGRNERLRARRHAPKAEEPREAEEERAKRNAGNDCRQEPDRVLRSEDRFIWSTLDTESLYSGGSNVSSRGDLQVDEFEIVQARFPCRSPDMHFFGYRFRIGLKGEYAFGGFAGTLPAQKWTWQILLPLSRLNIRK